jgi:cytochrome c556
MSARMNAHRMTLATASLVAALSASTVIRAEPAAPPAQRPEAVIKWRQSAFQVLAWSSGRIKAATEGPLDRAEVIKAASAIATIGSDLGRLFPPGTEQGRGWRETSARPEALSDPKRFGELAGSLSKEATELGRIAVSGDPAAVKEQYGKVTRSCKACHDAFRRDDY